MCVHVHIHITLRLCVGGVGARGYRGIQVERAAGTVHPLSPATFSQTLLEKTYNDHPEVFSLVGL